MISPNFETQAPRPPLSMTNSCGLLPEELDYFTKATKWLNSYPMTSEETFQESKKLYDKLPPHIISFLWAFVRKYFETDNFYRIEYERLLKMIREMYDSHCEERFKLTDQLFELRVKLYTQCKIPNSSEINQFSDLPF